MALEQGVVTPEAVTAKPPTILKQITEILKPRTEGEKADLFIAGVVNHDRYWAEVYMSPRQPTYDADTLNIFTSRLLKSLTAGIEGHDLKLDEVRNAKKLPSLRFEGDGVSFKGGIRLPYIRYGQEVIGKKITTTHFDVSDTLYHDEGKPEEHIITRANTEILIYPSSQVAELALAARQERDRLPKGFDYRIRHAISRRQIKDIAKTTLKPSSSNGQ